MLKSRRVFVSLLTVLLLLNAALPLSLVAAQDDAEWVVYASEFGYFVEHPADWVAGEDEDGVMLANSQAAFDKLAAEDSDDNPAAGEVGVLVLVLDLAEMGLPADTGLDMLYDLFVGSMAEDGMEALSDVETFELDGVEARKLEVKDEETGNEGLLVLTIKEGALIIGVQANAAGETAEHEETALMVIGSVSFETPEDGGAMDGGSLLDILGGGDGEALTQTFDSTTGVSFDYPEDWVAGDSDGQAVVANNQTVYDKMDAGGEENNPVEGEAGIVIVGLGLSDLGLPASTTVDVVFDMFVGAMTGEGLETTSEPETIMLGAVDAITVYITDSDGGGDGILVITIKDEALILGILVTAPDGVADFEATALDIIGSATYTAP